MIILEAGINHFGKTTEAKKLLNFFLSSNFNHLTFMIHTSKFYEDFKNKIDFELKSEFYEKALYLAHKKKKKIGVAVCDPVSFKKFSNIKFDFYKLLSISINNKKLIKMLNEKRREVFISLGKGSDKKIKKCIDCFSSKKKLRLIYTSMSYNPADLNIQRINELKKKFNLKVGYGHHYTNIKPLILSRVYNPSFCFLYIKKSPKKRKRIFPDHIHAFELDDLKKLSQDLLEIDTINQNKKTSFKIKINEIKKIKY